MMEFFILDERLMLLDLQQERQRVPEGLLDYIHRFRDLSLICYDLVGGKASRYLYRQYVVQVPFVLRESTNP